MRKYTDVTREQLEARKDFVEQVMRDLGAVPVMKTAASDRWVYRYQTGYYRVCSICFPDKPCLVLEWTDRPEYAKNNCMEDIDPFPYDLPDEKIKKIIKELLHI